MSRARSINDGFLQIAVVLTIRLDLATEYLKTKSFYDYLRVLGELRGSSSLSNVTLRKHATKAVFLRIGSENE
jgi:hypothetical protein